MTLRERIGVDVGSRLPAVDAVEWAADEGVGHVDLTIDDRLPEGFGDLAVEAIREACEDGGVSIGLHPNSAVNTAERGPFVGGATDEYLRAYVDAADRLAAEYVVVHGGYHFTADREERIEAALDRLYRVAEYADERGVRLLLENHNPEPEGAEVHYLPSTPAECVRFFEALPASVGLAFNPPHANLHPDGIPGFLDVLDLGRCGEVRLNDNRGEHEEHLAPGEGTIDFAALFERIEAEYDGPYTLAFGTLEAMLEGREYLVDVAEG